MKLVSTHFGKFRRLRIRHVTFQSLIVSGCCPGNVDDLGKSFCNNVLHSYSIKAQKELSQNVNLKMCRITVD